MLRRLARTRPTPCGYGVFCDSIGTSPAPNYDPSTKDDRTCSNGQSCNPPGNICGGSGATNASQNCCAGKKAVCKQDSNDIWRCFGGGSTACPAGYDANDPACCIPAGTATSPGGVCQFRDQCCNFAPCVPDAQGVLRCTTASCTPVDGACAGADDGSCCPGTVCTFDGATGFTCKVPSSCGANGRGCVVASECCSNNCAGDVCAPPCAATNAACTTSGDCCAGLGCVDPAGRHQRHVPVRERVRADGRELQRDRGLLQRRDRRAVHRRDVRGAADVPGAAAVLHRDGGLLHAVAGALLRRAGRVALRGRGRLHLRLLQGGDAGVRGLLGLLRRARLQRRHVPELHRGRFGLLGRLELLLGPGLRNGGHRDRLRGRHLHVRGLRAPGPVLHGRRDRLLRWRERLPRRGRLRVHAGQDGLHLQAPGVAAAIGSSTPSPRGHPAPRQPGVCVVAPHPSRC